MAVIGTTLITGCKIDNPVYACNFSNETAHLCNITAQYEYACIIQDWVWFDTSDYYIYGFAADNRYSYLKESGYRVY